MLIEGFFFSCLVLKSKGVKTSRQTGECKSVPVLGYKFLTYFVRLLFIRFVTRKYPTIDTIVGPVVVAMFVCIVSHRQTCDTFRLVGKSMISIFCVLGFPYDIEDQFR